MSFSEKSDKAYSSGVIFLSLFSLLFAFGCTMLGYLFFPFAAGAYAALLLFENHNKRFFSYAVPVLSFIVNFIFCGIFSEHGVAYAIVGLLIYYSYSKKRTKNECVALCAIAVAALLHISLVFFAFNSTNYASFAAVKDFYTNFFLLLKNDFVNTLTALETVADDGNVFILINVETAEELFSSLIALIPSAFAVITFLLVGLSVKVFSAFVAKLSDGSGERQKWSFLPPPLLAYVYIAFAILELLSSGSSIISYSISNLYLILQCVFFYAGIKFIYRRLRTRFHSFFSFAVILLGASIFGKTALVLTSFVGVYRSLRSKKTESGIKS